MRGAVRAFLLRDSDSSSRGVYWVEPGRACTRLGRERLVGRGKGVEREQNERIAGY